MKDDVQLAEGGSLACHIPMELTLPATFQLGESWFDVKLETVRPETFALETAIGPTSRSTSMATG